MQLPWRKRVALFLLLVSIILVFPTSMTASAQINVSAKSAILMEQESGRVLFAKDPHEQRRIASITKIMTAILAVESGKMDRMVTVSKTAANTEGSSLYLKPGEKMRLEDLVYGLMLRSGNDAAVAIAEFLGGSVAGFSVFMNEKAQLIGMKDTMFSNPHGLDDHEQHYSTAYDMALLTKYAMQNEKFRKIFGTKLYRIPEYSKKAGHVWKNKNKLLRMYPYTTGGKTGYTQRARRTLVSTAKKDDLRFIAVTINDANDWDDHMRMYNWGFENYDFFKIIDEGLIEGLNNDFYQGKVFTKKAFYLPLSGKELEKVSLTINLLEPPKTEEWKTGEAPSPVGEVLIKLEDQTVGELPLFYDEKKVEKKNFWEMFQRIFFITAGVRFNG